MLITYIKYKDSYSVEVYLILIQGAILDDAKSPQYNLRIKYPQHIQVPNQNHCFVHTRVKTYAFHSW